MKKIKVNPGECGLESVITAEKKGRKDVTVTVETKCKGVKAMIEALEQPLDGYAVLTEKPGSGKIYEAAANLIHGACPEAAAVVKCVEAECGLALPRDVSFTFVEE